MDSFPETYNDPIKRNVHLERCHGSSFQLLDTICNIIER